MSVLDSDLKVISSLKPKFLKKELSSYLRSRAQEKNPDAAFDVLISILSGSLSSDRKLVVERAKFAAFIERSGS